MSCGDDLIQDQVFRWIYCVPRLTYAASPTWKFSVIHFYGIPFPTEYLSVVALIKIIFSFLLGAFWNFNILLIFAWIFLKFSGLLQLYNVSQSLQNDEKIYFRERVIALFIIFQGLWFPYKGSESTKDRALVLLNLNNRSIEVVHIVFCFLLFFFKIAIRRDQKLGCKKM